MTQPMYGTKAWYDYWRQRGLVTMEEQYLDESKKMTSRIDLPELLRRVMTWKTWTKDGSGVLMSNGQSICDLRLYDLARPAIDEIEDYLGKSVKYLMVNILPAGIVVPVHTDTLVDNSVSRWHLPLKTNKHAWFWDEAGFSHLELGVWREVDYKQRHTIGNFGHTDRVHLIVDLW